MSLADARDAFLGGAAEAASPAPLQAPAPVPALEAVLREERLAIIGPPGSGKSTLLQHVLLTVATGELCFDEGCERPLPLRVTLRALDWAHLPPPEDLVRVVANSVIAQGSQHVLPGLLDRGDVLMMFDGLDEVPAAHLRQVEEWVASYITRYPECRFIVASRPTGYRRRVLAGLGFADFELCPLTERQVRAFVRQWAAAAAMAEGATRAEAEQQADPTAQELLNCARANAYVMRLAENPLLLSTLCLVQKYEGGDLPNRRVVLYERCLEGLLFHWDNRRGLPPSVLGSLSLGQRLMILRRVALEMQCAGLAEMPADRLLATTETALQAMPGVPNVAAPSAIESIRNRSGLLAERRPGMYAFSHLTFQEYLAAVSIHEGDVRAVDRLFLLRRRNHKDWQEVIALYAGVATRAETEGLIEELLPGSPSLAVECLAAAEVPDQKHFAHLLRCRCGHDWGPVERLLRAFGDGLRGVATEVVIASGDASPLAFTYLAEVGAGDLARQTPGGLAEAGPAPATANHQGGPSGAPQLVRVGTAHHRRGRRARRSARAVLLSAGSRGPRQHRLGTHLARPDPVAERRGSVGGGRATQATRPQGLDGSRRPDAVARRPGPPRYQRPAYGRPPAPGTWASEGSSPATAGAAHELRRCSYPGETARQAPGSRRADEQTACLVG